MSRAWGSRRLSGRVCARVCGAGEGRGGGADVGQAAFTLSPANGLLEKPPLCEAGGIQVARKLPKCPAVIESRGCREQTKQENTRR